MRGPKFTVDKSVYNHSKIHAPEALIAHSGNTTTMTELSYRSYHLNGDFFLTDLNEGKFIYATDSEAMAAFYGVPVEEYLAGQEWAREHLADLRREAGLDPDTGEPLPTTNGAKPEPAAAPALPAPHRNGHKASMVTHRVRR